MSSNESWHYQHQTRGPRQNRPQSTWHQQLHRESPKFPWGESVWETLVVCVLPSKFDACRFLGLRNGAAGDLLGYKSKGQYQFITVTKDFTRFGFGRQSCPGRFFPANEIKLSIARILIDYDIRMLDGLIEHYANTNTSIDSFPDPTRRLYSKGLRNPSKWCDLLGFCLGAFLFHIDTITTSYKAL
ncbi:hypothetical protein GGS26DRAFT_599353 [Hypomontagnella submonticulosa]|nr:hypothetical protein GGS26DRAFT_599353 [Hypomontagnella submonticulosa]